MDKISCFICEELATLVEPIAGEKDHFKIECPIRCDHYFISRTLYSTGKFKEKCSLLTKKQRRQTSHLVSGKEFHSANLDWFDNPIIGPDEFLKEIQRRLPEAKVFWKTAPDIFFDQRPCVIAATSRTNPSSKKAMRFLNGLGEAPLGNDVERFVDYYSSETE